MSWPTVAAAALAMVATLPGRTHGLGLFTEPLLRSFALDRESYGAMNLVATLLGSLFCLPCGWLSDRLGVRAVTAGVLAALATATTGLGLWTGGAAGLFVLILLTRGFGQSALSVSSLTLIGHAAGPRPGLAMGVYALLTSLGFMAAFAVLREVIKANPEEWRTPWLGIGVGVLVVGVLIVLLARPTTAGVATTATGPSRTLGQALRTRAFWAFALGTSFYGLVAAGTSLFNESILAERGFSKDVFLTATLVGIPAVLVANFLGGWLATRVPLGRLLAVGLVGLAAALSTYPLLSEVWHAYTYAVALAAAGGLITVCFFTVWRPTFGPAALGRIQGAAQWLTVIFSALGPMLFASAKTRWGAYATLFPALAAVALALALFAWFAPTRRETS